MNRKNQAPPRQGSFLRVSPTGTSMFQVPAITRFPPPEFLSEMGQNLWVAHLSDVPLELFRARHVPMMIQYVRAVEMMMTFSDQLIDDPEDAILVARWSRMSRIVMSFEKHLASDAKTLLSTVLRARADMRAAQQGQSAKDASELVGRARAGLVYAGH